MQTKSFFPLGLAEEEAVIVGTAESSVWQTHYSAAKLVDGLGLDGSWPSNGCAHTERNGNEWFSFELRVPQKITRVNIVNRDASCERGRNIRITIGPSKGYDPNEPLCLEIPELVCGGGFQDFWCTDLHVGKFVKISRAGNMNLCEVEIFSSLSSGK